MESRSDRNCNSAALEPLGGNPGVSINLTVPYLERYFFGFHRAIGRNTVFEMNYLGSDGKHIANGISVTPSNPAACLALDAATLAPGQTPCGPNLETIDYTLANGSAVPGSRTLNVEDNWLCFSKNSLYESEGLSNYHALDVELKHTSTHWDALFSYTWGKSMDEGSTQGGAVYVYNPHASYALSAYNVPQYLVASYTLHLPFAQWTSNPAARHIIGG